MIDLAANLDFYKELHHLRLEHDLCSCFKKVKNERHLRGDTARIPVSAFSIQLI